MDHEFPLREYKDKHERSLDNSDIDYTHMYENAGESDTTILHELGSVLNVGPTLEELNEEMERPEFIKDTE